MNLRIAALALLLIARTACAENLLGAKLYDPAGAVTKATSSLLAMTAFDTTNLRIAFTVPAHGMVHVKIMTNLSGAITMPQVMLGVLEGSTVRGRQVAMASIPGTALATTNVPLFADFIVVGLSPGAVNWDAAYAVETLVAATNIHYGGPNNTTVNDAWGAFSFQVWDPQPQTTTGQLSVDANGRLDVIKVAGTTQTARDLGAQLDAAVSTRMATYTQPTGFLAATFPGTVASTTNITAGTITTATNLTNAPTAGDFNATMKTSLNAATPASVTGAVGSVTGAVGSVTGNVGGNVSGSVGSVTAAVSVTGDLSATMKTSVTTAATAATPTAAAVTGAVGSVTGAVGSVTGNVGGNVAGSVGSVVGAVGSVTGNLGGNVAGSVGSVTTVSDKTGYALSAAYDPAKTAAQAGTDSTGTTTILGRLTATRAGNLDYLDGAITSRASSATALSTTNWSTGRAANLDFLDKAISAVSCTPEPPGPEKNPYCFRNGKWQLCR